MAYSRAKSWSLRGSSRYGKKKRGGVRRRSYGKKRTYRKYRAPSKRKMIDMMSVKKKDTMMSQAAVGINPNPNSTVVSGGLLITDTTTSTYHAGIHMTLQIPSYRFLVANNSAFKSFRTSTRPFIKGLFEQYQIAAADASVWEHRRIVWSSKDVYSATVAANIGAMSAQGDAVSYRVFRDMSGVTSGNYTDLQTRLYDVVFQGIDSVDWRTPFLAKVDRSRVNLLSDTKYQISTNNAVPRTKYKKFWTPINRTIQYDDEENGLNVSPSPISVSSKSGMGNIFVLDLFQCVNKDPATTAGNAVLQVSSSQTLYWHEK